MKLCFKILNCFSSKTKPFPISTAHPFHNKKGSGIAFKILQGIILIDIRREFLGKFRDLVVIKELAVEQFYMKSDDETTIRVVSSASR
jgi:hypothetical protein